VLPRADAISLPYGCKKAVAASIAALKIAGPVVLLSSDHENFLIFAA
jgi:hypothetical protein